MVQLTDASGNVVRSYEYDAFGNELNPTAGDNNPFRYCCEYFDTETGSYYLRARYYNPSSGRFLSEDPIRAGFNWYAYCNSNPIRFIDPSGNAAVDAFKEMSYGDYIVRPPIIEPVPPKNLSMSDEGVQMLMYLELARGYAPYLFTDDGIYPHWVGDEGITIGYGHCISKGDLKTDAYDKALYDTYTPNAKVNGSAKANGYPKIVTDSEGNKYLVVPYSVVDAILNRDITMHAKEINDWANKYGITFSQQQFDALIMMRHYKGYLDEICDLILYYNADKDKWKADAKIGNERRKTAQLDLYFDGIYIK